MHVMLDLETWGTAPGCAVPSIGAVTFDPYDDSDAPSWQASDFYANIDRESCEAAGLTIDPKTAEWWSRQSQAAQSALLTNPQPLVLVAQEFRAWWLRCRATFVWCNGAGFDEPIWRAATEKVGLDVPWKYWNVRDTRTIWDVADIDPKRIPRAGVAHNAYADARHQALCVTRAYAALGFTRLAPARTGA